MKKVNLSYANFTEASQQDIRKTCKIGYGKKADQSLENAIRKHLDGANAKERRDFYNQFYGRKDK